MRQVGMGAVESDVGMGGRAGGDGKTRAKVQEGIISATGQPTERVS